MFKIEMIGVEPITFPSKTTQTTRIQNLIKFRDDCKKPLISFYRSDVVSENMIDIVRKRLDANSCPVVTTLVRTVQTSRDWPKSAPYLRLKYSKGLQSVKVFSSTAPEKKLKKCLTMPKK